MRACGKGEGLELIDPAEAREFGPADGDHQDDDEAAESAEDNGGNGSEEPGGEAGFEATEFIGHADEDAIDGGDAAAHGVGSEGLHEGGANDDADVIERAQGCEEEEGEEEGARCAEGDGGEPEAGDRGDEGATGVLEGRAVGNEECHGESAEGGSSAEPAEAGRADFEDIPGEDGEECGCAAEEDGEEVERECGQDEFVVCDELCACEEGPPVEGGTGEFVLGRGLEA